MMSAAGPNLIIRSEGGKGYNRTTNRPNWLKTFLKGEPEALGATQIFGGVVILVFGIAALKLFLLQFNMQLSIMIYSGLPFWSSILYISSGSVSLSASVKPTNGKVKAYLVLNIISAVFSGIGILVLILGLVIPFRYPDNPHCIYQPHGLCKGEFDVTAALYGFLSIVLIFSVLMFCIAIASSVFGCRTACRGANSEVYIVSYQATVVAPDQTAEAAPMPTTDPTMMHGSSTALQDN